LVFTGEDPSELRGHAFNEVRAVLVIGGQAGTAEEVQRARELDMGVVPLAATGGIAREVWDAVGADFGAYRLGGQYVDRDEFDRLAHPDAAIAVAAAVQLAKQALFL
jgi:predicted Rossmann-fold nucleotide-binding protein